MRWICSYIMILSAIFAYAQDAAQVVDATDTIPRKTPQQLKKEIKKERHTFELGGDLQLGQTQFDNWAAGGQNTFSTRTTLTVKHNYKKNKFSIENRFAGRYGMNIIDNKALKNEDEFIYNIKTMWSMRGSWSYAGTANLRSQFSVGRTSREDNTRVSNFMAPGFLDLSLGFNYNRAQSPLSITLSPLTGTMISMLDDELSKKGGHGVEAGKKSKSDIGSSVNLTFDKKFGKSMFRYYSNLFSFTNYKIPPTARFENKLEISPVKFLKTTLFCVLYYDERLETPRTSKLQVNYSLGLGIAYSFKNK